MSNIGTLPETGVVAGGSTGIDTGSRPSLPMEIILHIAQDSSLNLSDISSLRQTCHGLSELLRGYMYRRDVVEVMAIERSLPEQDVPDAVRLSAEEKRILRRPCIPHTRISALHWAARHGVVSVARDAIEASLRISPEYLDSKDSLHYTPLAIAAENGHADVVFELLNAGCYVEAPIPGFTFSPFSGFHTGHKYVHRDSRFASPIILAIAAQQESIAVILALNTKRILNGENEESQLYPPLPIAARFGMRDLVVTLLSQGHPAGWTRSLFPYSPLRCAIYHADNCEVLDILMTHGANYEEVDSSVALSAVDTGKMDNVAFLVSISGDPDVSSWIESAMIEYLANDDRFPVVEATVRVLNNHGIFDRIQKLLQEAMVWYGSNDETLEFFANFLATEINKEYLPEGQGYLHWAVRQEDLVPYVIDFVITETKLDVNVRDASGFTPLDYAEQREHSRMIGILRDHFGAKRGYEIVD